MRNIARALVEHTRNKKFVSEMFKQFELKKNQRIRIEDLLQIFVDDIDQLKDFLKFVIEEFGERFSAELEKLTSINLYHRLLECYLYKN